MAKTDPLIIPIKTDNRDFRKGLKQTRSQLQTSLPIGAGTIGGLLTGAAVLGGVQAIRNTTNELIDYSTQLGISVQDTQAMNEVFVKQGITLERGARLLGAMNKRIADAKRGTGEALPLFAEMGLNFEELSKMAPDKQFIALAAAINKLPKSEQLGAALKIFGEEGAPLLRVILQGVSEINRQREKAVQVTRQDIAAIKEFNDNLDLTITRLKVIGAKRTNVAFDILNEQLGFKESGGKGSINEIIQGLFTDDSKTMEQQLAVLKNLETFMKGDIP